MGSILSALSGISPLGCRTYQVGKHVPPLAGGQTACVLQRFCCASTDQIALDEGHDKLPMRVLLVALLATLLCQGAAAQYPSRPIRLLVGFPPGGGPDIVARILAPKLSEALGQPVVVENRVGSTGTIAGEAVAKSPPDGHTLLVGHDGLFVINPHLYKEMPIDPLKDLVPVTSLVSNGFFMAVNPSVPAQTFPQFIEY